MVKESREMYGFIPDKTTRETFIQIAKDSHMKHSELLEYIIDVYINDNIVQEIIEYKFNVKKEEPYKRIGSTISSEKLNNLTLFKEKFSNLHLTDRIIFETILKNHKEKLTNEEIQRVILAKTFKLLDKVPETILEPRNKKDDFSHSQDIGDLIKQIVKEELNSIENNTSSNNGELSILVNSEIKKQQNKTDLDNCDIVEEINPINPKIELTVDDIQQSSDGRIAHYYAILKDISDETNYENIVIKNVGIKHAKQYVIKKIILLNEKLNK